MQMRGEGGGLGEGTPELPVCLLGNNPVCGCTSWEKRLSGGREQAAEGCPGNWGAAEWRRDVAGGGGHSSCLPRRGHAVNGVLGSSGVRAHGPKE